LCEMQPFTENGRPFNLAELLCGSEGTLAVTTSAKVNLVPDDAEQIVLVPHFTSIRAAMEATVEAVKMNPAAVELVDDIILDATKGNIEQQKNRFFLRGEPKAVLIIKFEGDNMDKLTQVVQKLADRFKQLRLSKASPIITE